MNKQSRFAAITLGLIGGFTLVNSYALSMSNFYDATATSTFCQPGFYVGVQGGRSDTYYKNNDVSAPMLANSGGVLYGQNVDDRGWGGRVFAGYQFNPYFAAELGYTQFPKTTFVSQSTVTTPVVSQNISVNQVNNGYITEEAGDLVGKITMPIPGGFGAYIKGGVAYITAYRAINTATSSSNVSLGQFSTYTQNYNSILPTYGAGLVYTVPKTNVSAEVFWQRIQNIGGGAIPNADLMGVGLSYKFA